MTQPFKRRRIQIRVVPRHFCWEDYAAMEHLQAMIQQVLVDTPRQQEGADGAPVDVVVRTVPDEQLETQVSEAGAKLLDTCDAEANVNSNADVRNDVQIESEKTISLPEVTAAEVVEKVRVADKALRDFIKGQFRNGWRITARLAERVGQLMSGSDL